MVDCYSTCNHITSWLIVCQLFFIKMLNKIHFYVIIHIRKVGEQYDNARKYGTEN